MRIAYQQHVRASTTSQAALVGYIDGYTLMYMRARTFTRINQATLALPRQAHTQVRAPDLGALGRAACNRALYEQADAPCEDIAADCSF